MNKEKNNQNKRIFLSIIIILIFTGISCFFLIDFNEEQKSSQVPLLGPMDELPKLDPVILNDLIQRYGSCSKPKIINASSSLTVFNSSVLLDNNNATIWSSRNINAAYLDLTYSGGCNFTKININFGTIPVGRGGTLSLVCLDNMANTFYSSSFSFTFSGKSKEFSFSKQTCSKFRVHFRWSGTYTSYFNVREIKFS